MADPDTVPSDKDEPTGSDGDSPDIDITPSDVEPTAAAPAAPDEPSGEPEPAAAPTAEPASVDFSKVPADEIVGKLLERTDVLERIFQSEPVKRAIQSEKDKEIARAERQRRDEDRRKRDDERRRLDEEEKQKLLEENDYAGLGELEARRIRDEKQLSTAAARVAGVIEKVVREHPDFAVLGEEKIDEAYADTQRSGGSVIDFTLKLAEARRHMDVERAVADSTKGLSERIAAEVEAALAAAGVEKRSEEVKGGNAPSKTISGGSTPKSSSKTISEDDAMDRYNDGDMTWAEFKPYWDAIEARRQR